MLALATRAGTTRVDSCEEFASASVMNCPLFNKLKMVEAADISGEEDWLADPRTGKLYPSVLTVLMTYAYGRLDQKYRGWWAETVW